MNHQLPLHEPHQVLPRPVLYLPLKKTVPAQEPSREAQCLAGPLVQTERIAVLNDLSIGKTHVGLYLIDHLPAGFGKGIGSRPVAGTVLFIEVLYVTELKRKIFRVGAKHGPHAAYLIAFQQAKGGIEEYNIPAVAGIHPLCVELLEGGIELRDE